MLAPHSGHIACDMFFLLSIVLVIASWTNKNRRLRMFSGRRFAHGVGAAQLSRTGVRLLALLLLAVKQVENVHAAPQTKNPPVWAGFHRVTVSKKTKEPRLLVGLGLLRLFGKTHAKHQHSPFLMLPIIIREIAHAYQGAESPNILVQFARLLAAKR
jgi:hypothetical protein